MSILICYDDSHSARRALAAAQRTLAHQKAVLLHVYSAPEAVLADAFSTRSTHPTSGPASLDRMESMAAQRAQEVADGARALMAEGEQQAEIEVREAPGDVPLWQAILDAADEIDAELIVAGTHGQTAVQDEMLGSVSGGLVRHSRRPVLIVPVGR